ncbi:MAG: hypothetical protein LBS62_09095 [Clostridiales bacterium]|jgi:hypothetical protein|nr:hypothetical protein [Clostridiales bacterium]
MYNIKKAIGLAYRKIDSRHPAVMEFLRFWIIGNLVTVFQFIGMPVLKSIFSATSLININFQVLRVGLNFDGSPYYIFDYAAGALPEGGGGLAFFLAVHIVLLFSQVISFPLQRNLVFKSAGNPFYQAMWFLIAFFVITFAAGAAQGLYKRYLYNLFIHELGLEKIGEQIADVITAFLYACISFWVYFPIFKIIFIKRV